MIDLYAAGTSNGMRARIALEECGLKYNWHFIDLTKGERWFCSAADARNAGWRASKV